MSVLKNLLDVTLSDGVKLLSETRRRVKPYLPLAAELYNELATRSPISIPKIDVDKLIDSLYPKQDLDSAWTRDAEPYIPASPAEDDLEPEIVDEPEGEAEPTAVVSEPEPPVAKVVPEPVATVEVPEVIAAPEPMAEPAPAPVAEPEPLPVAAVVTLRAPKAPKEAPAPVAPAAKATKPAKPAAKPRPRGKKKDDAQQTLIAAAPPAPRYTLDGLLEMKKTELLDLAREHKLDLKSNATKQAIAEAILAS